MDQGGFQTGKDSEEEEMMICMVRLLSIITYRIRMVADNSRAMGNRVQSQESIT